MLLSLINFKNSISVNCIPYQLLHPVQFTMIYQFFIQCYVGNITKYFLLFQALLYLITLLDPIVKGDYVIAYFHTLTSSSNYPSFSWLREVYNILPYKYKKNLKAFYVIHPTFWTKVSCIVPSNRPFLQFRIWNHYGIRELNQKV